MPSVAPAPLAIDYVSEGFPIGSPVINGPDVLRTSWNELLWAALTVGRPNRQYFFRHGNASIYEAIFRLSLTRMALEQSGPTARRLRRTEAAKTLDPSEKGAVNYFLGMTLCKLFSARLLHAPWLLHLDVFRPQLNPVLRGRSRPDLVGQTDSNDWVTIESKGRISPPSPDAKDKAKQQAQRLVSVNGRAPSFHIGGITYFRNDVLQFFWRDPEPNSRQRKTPIKVDLEDNTWGYYYLPVFELVRSRPEDFRKMLREPVLVPVKEVDIEVGIYPPIIELLAKENWGEAKEQCYKREQEIAQAGYRADGIGVVAGPTWFLPLEG